MIAVIARGGGGGGGGSGESGPCVKVSDVRFKLSIDKKTRNFEPGEVIDGTLSIKEVPSFVGSVSLMVVFEGKYYDTPYQTQGIQIIQVEKPIIGHGSSVKEMKIGEYKFGIHVPADCPPSFSCGGRLKYNIRLVANRVLGKLTLYHEKLVYITPKFVSSWANQDALTPKVMNKEMGGEQSTNVYVWLKTNQSCYSPGTRIEFLFKVQNGGSKKIRCIKLCLIQLVHLKSVKSTYRNDLSGINNGPSVESNSAQVWSGHLDVPAPLPPSLEQANRCVDLAAEFHYKLQVTLEIGPYLKSAAIVDEFPIQIAKAFSAEMIAGSVPPNRRFEPLEMTAEELNSRRRMSTSVVSLTPSLPDYRTAVMRAKIPPAYSNLDFSDLSED